MNKRKILDQVIEALQREEAMLISAGLAAREAATESEAKPENEYDTRGLEQSYLAAGQSRRAEALKDAIMELKVLPLQAFDASSSIDLTALVPVETDEGEHKLLFLLPSQGGLNLLSEGKEILTVSPESPLGKNLLGKSVGDGVEMITAKQTRAYSILSIE